MAAFRYEAVDAAGRARRGMQEAPNARAVRDQLRIDGLFPTAIEPAAALRTARTEATRLGSAALSLTTRQLATLVASGNAQGTGNALDIVDGDVAFPALHRADVGAVQSGQLGQGFLG